MMKVSKWDLVGCVAVALITVILLISCHDFAHIDFDTASYSIIVNQTMDLFGMAVCLVLLLTILFDHRISTGTAYFMAFITLECILLFWDFEAWMVDGDPSQILFNKIINYSNYGFVLFLLLAFWLYIKQLADRKDRMRKALEVVYYVAFAAGMLIILTNPFTHFIFTIDEETGVYSRGELFWLSLLAPLVLVILNTIVIKRYITGRRKKIGLYSYSLMPVLGAVVQIMFYGIQVIYIAMLYSLILIYGNFYVERGQEIATKDAKISEQKISMIVARIQPDVLDRTLTLIKNIEGNPPETVEAIDHFSRYMRGNLKTLSQKDTIPFATEMKHVRTYVDLEKLRFKEKLNVTYDIRDTEFRLPALTMQMLVENAIKHGVTVKEDGGTVKISTYSTIDGHVITVSDDGVGFDTGMSFEDDDQSHVGLANVKQRIEEMCEGKLEITSWIDRGTVVRITIPKESAN